MECNFDLIFFKENLKTKKFLTYFVERAHGLKIVANCYKRRVIIKFHLLIHDIVLVVILVPLGIASFVLTILILFFHLCFYYFFPPKCNVL